MTHYTVTRPMLRRTFLHYGLLLRHGRFSCTTLGQHGSSSALRLNIRTMGGFR